MASCVTVKQNNCTSKHRHFNFTPVSRFSTNNLPEALQTDSVLKYIKNYAARTVKVISNQISNKRPDDAPFAHLRGEEFIQNASGWIIGISTLQGPCVCPECHSKTQPEEQCWEVIVSTACHVVYNSEEAKSTRVELFYNNETSSDNGEIKVLFGTEVEYTNPEEDRSILVCVTHDRALAMQLEAYRKERVSLWRDILREAPYNTEHSQCVLVSHPHGGPKQISVGQQLDKINRSAPANVVYTYDTDVCPESSGGPVIVLPGKDCLDPGWLPVAVHHSEINSINVNTSGVRSVLWV